MPIEIKEVVFRINVDEQAPPSRQPAGNPDSSADKQEIVEACVEEVMEIIQERKER